MVSLGSLLVKALALATVVSSECPSTTITSKSRKDCWERSERRWGKYLASFRAGIMIEKKGFILAISELVLFEMRLGELDYHQSRDKQELFYPKDGQLCDCPG